MQQNLNDNKNINKQYNNRVFSDERGSITLNYFGMQLQNDIYQIVEQYGVTQLVNFSRKTDTVPITCENSLGDKKECQINMTRNMKTNVRDQIVYFAESASELSQLQYTIMETSNSVWKESIILFGVSMAVLACCLVYYSGGPSKCFFELGRRMKFII
ncbi:Hypothetical_protein [Hexamita inflata]|uniref:Hypothetical_protein n=1 Tax=Hexamita inflata TaxID=28002 RepID=A0AA86RC61_9EUKA|nr:Hypothetical protein HINF_LOCUS58042 [Hexamita inflata]